MELLQGCTDINACNYHPNATLNNGCFYNQENYDCEGHCIAQIDCNGKCGGTAVKDICGICEGTITNLVDCECPLDSSGQIVIRDCNGICGGEAQNDICGVCMGSGPNGGYNCAMECIEGVDCEGVCDGSILPDFECQNGSLVCNAIDCENIVELSLYAKSIPDNYSIMNIYPNPFNSSTKINYSLLEKANLNISIFNIRGRETEILFSGYQNPGYYSINWNASKYPSGIYFVMMSSEKYKQIRKLALIK